MNTEKPDASASFSGGGRAILHVDMDAFFAAVEVLDRPELAGKPVIVGGRPELRGVVSTANYEARAYGVHSAMSSARAMQLCPQAVFLDPHFQRYSEISRQVFAILKAYSPLVEAVSIDEAFVDLTGSQRLFGPAESIARTIKQRIRDETRLVASAGLAPNKFLAKLASDLEKPDGFVVIREGEAEELLASLPVGKLWGVGKVAEAALARLEIRTMRDLREASIDLVRRHFGSSAEHLLRLARGEDDREVESGGEAKSVGAETTFAVDIADAGELRRTLDGLAERVARRLRKEGWQARTIQLKARYPDFTTLTRAMTLPTPASATSTIRKAARELLESRLGRGGRALRLIGVSASQLTRAGEGQLELFGDAENARAETLDRVMDRLNEKHGGGAIGHGMLKDGRG